MEGGRPVRAHARPDQLPADRRHHRIHGRAARAIEVKTNAKRHNSAQNRRIRAARSALGRAGPLPGDDRGEWLYDLDLPYRTHLDLLRTGTERAAREGSSLPGSAETARCW